jgi:hypothetical protein
MTFACHGRDDVQKKELLLRTFRNDALPHMPDMRRQSHGRLHKCRLKSPTNERV